MNKTEAKELIEAEFKKVDRHVNIVLFVSLAIFLPISLINFKYNTGVSVISVALNLGLAGMFAYIIRFSVVHKKRICLKHGLVCPHCGKPPIAGLAIRSLESNTCFRCKKIMEPK